MSTEYGFARDRIAQVYFGLTGEEESQIRAKARIDWLASEVDHSHVLDVGCSEGILPILLGRKGIHVTGIDINPEAIEYASNLLSSEQPEVKERVKFVCGDIMNGSLIEATYEYIILGEIIEHFSEPSRIVAEVVNHLKPGGKLLITTPLGFFPDPDHRYTFTLSSFLRIFKNLDLSPISLSVVDGYIRFVAKQNSGIHDEKEWDTLDRSVLEMTEQSMIDAQKTLFARIDRLRNGQRMLRTEYKQLQEDYQRLFTKYKGLMARYHLIRSSKIIQLNEEVKELIKPVRFASLLIPWIIMKYFIKWLMKKNKVKRVGASAQNLLRITGLLKEDSFDEVSQENSFLESVEAFVNRANENPEKPVVVISTGTKRMGNLKRINRTMAFARELSNLKIPVIYIYYRWKAKDDEKSDYDGSYLLQLPNDFYHKIASQIATSFASPQKLFVISIPDLFSVPELELFRMNGWKVGYEVRDEWSEFKRAGAANWYDPAYEMYISTHADFVTTVSSRLQQKMLEFGANPDTTFIVPNGLNGDFLERAQFVREMRKDGYRGNGTIGYFGHLTDKWFNWNLLIETAKKRPDFMFEIIGFDAPKLKLPSNIQLLGEKTHDQIIEIAKDWSVAIIPFNNNELSRAVDPIKLYEYQALGLPCVSCRMDQIIGYPFTFIFDKDERFEEKLAEAINFQPTLDDWERLENFATQNTWKSRLETTLQIAGIKVPDERQVS